MEGSLLLLLSIFQSSTATPGNKATPGKGDLPIWTLSLVVQSLQKNAIRAKNLTNAALSADLDALLASLSGKLPEPQVREAGDKASNSIQQYFCSLSRCIDSVGLDLATSIRALATLLHRNSGSQGDFLEKMEHIRVQFQAGHTLDDIHALRSHLDSCLVGLRNEISSARQAHNECQGDLMQQLSQLTRSVSTLRATVPQVFSSGPAVSILRLRRVQAIRTRYGDAFADRFVNHVIQILLVRWPVAHDISPFTDECLIVIDAQNLDLDFHRAILRRLASERIIFTYQHEGREITIPVAIDWTVIRAPADGDIRDFISNFLEGMVKKDAQTASLDSALAS